MKQMLFLFICLILLSCSKGKYNQLETELNDLYKKEFLADEPGGSILVKKGKKTLFLKSFGLADLKTGDNNTEKTLFNTGSISKTFVSNGILILKEEGLLSLDDSLSEYFNDFDNTELAGKIKIKHLLSHTSGLPDLRNVRDNIEFYLTAKDKENFEPLKRADSLNFEPGDKYQYSNPAYNGLALIIEELSGEPWQRYIENKIFKPSGMNDSKITNGPYPQDGVAHAYYKDDNGKFIEYDYGECPTFAAAGNGGVWSSVLDLAKYEEAIQNNIFLSEELMNVSRTRFIPENWNDTINPFIGYSWFVDEDFLFKKQCSFEMNLVYHTGSQGGFEAFYITIPEKDILFIGLFNRPLSNYRKLIIDSFTLFQKYNWMDKV